MCDFNENYSGYFQAFDTDRNGKLSQREVEQMFSGHGMPFSVAEEAFHQADTDGDWQLDASGTVILRSSTNAKYNEISNFRND
jgi:Ca2+-binding EF-hand superfamily protein